LILELKVNQVMSVGDGTVRLLLVRRGLKARIEPISQTEEQKIAQSIAAQVQQVMGTVFPGGVIVGGAAGGPQWDARIDMQITEEEYQQLGKPGINDTINMDISKGSL
jgi:3-oxoacyl-ACP reductase-like protein